MKADFSSFSLVKNSSKVVVRHGKVRSKKKKNVANEALFHCTFFLEISILSKLTQFVCLQFESTAL